MSEEEEQRRVCNLVRCRGKGGEDTGPLKTKRGVLGPVEVSLVREIETSSTTHPGYPVVWGVFHPPTPHQLGGDKRWPIS